MTATAHRTVTIRHAAQGDAFSLRRLAELDSSCVPVGEVLLAEVDGTAHAALAITTRAVIADPFERTAHLVELLRTAASAESRPEPARPRHGIVASARARIAAARGPRLAGV